MISFIEGKIIEIINNELLILTSAGIGHLVYFYHPAEIGETQKLYITHIFRETEQLLFSHPTFMAKKCFELLISVKGVGPKSAFLVMSKMPVSEIYQACAAENPRVFQSIPGIGSKTAAQIILDLKSKMKKISLPANTSPVPLVSDVVFEALGACEALGLTRVKAYDLVMKVMNQDKFKNRNDIEAKELVQVVLKQMV